jgi:D-glycero-alpha-D-manno-heptose-7-phosphate kinase
MLISKTPLRVSLLGGGTDYPEFIDREYGQVLGGTIDKYVSIISSDLSNIAKEKLRISYRSVESVESLAEISHPIVREYLKLVKFDKKVAFYTVSDIPGSSGLGSSSAFSVGFINLIDAIYEKKRSKLSLAKMAIHLEREILKEPVGVQDQFHAAFGGFSKYTFKKDQESISQLNWDANDYNFINNRVILVHTGGFRNAKNILIDQQADNRNLSKDQYLSKMLEIANSGYNEIKFGLNESNFKNLCELVNESWHLKQSLSDNISNLEVDNIINIGKKSGAYAAKLLGAGGAGFVLFMGAPDLCEKIKNNFEAHRVVDINFVDNASKVITI